MLNQIRYKKINRRALDKALVAIEAAFDERTSLIFKFSHFRPMDNWRNWANPWGGRIIIDDTIRYNASLEVGDLFLFSEEDVVAKWSRKETFNKHQWYWGEDEVLRIFSLGRRADPIELFVSNQPGRIKEKDGNKDKVHSR
jgi:hypothetical protein